MGSRNPNPIEAIPGTDEFDNVVNPGDTIAMATKSGGGAYINKGRYLGQRKPGRSWYGKDFKCYVVEQDLTHTVRRNAAGVEWVFNAWRTTKVGEAQLAEAVAVIGERPVRPQATDQMYSWNFQRNNPKEYAELRKLWDEYNLAERAWREKLETWLNANYPTRKEPYVRRSTLWLNKIIKL